MPMKPTSAIRDEPQNNRLVMAVPGGEAFATYRRIDGDLIISHTEVPAALRGQGLGSELARGIVELARSRGERIVPDCSFLANWVRLHPEHQGVLGSRREPRR